MDLLNILNIDRDMIIIYSLIGLMAILLIIIFTLDAKSKRKSMSEDEIVIEGTTPLEKYQETNNLQAKVEQKIQELESIKQNNVEESIKEEVLEVETPVEERNEESTIKYVEDKTEEEQLIDAKKELDQVALNLIEDKTNAINLTNFEIEQEENAIISYNELVKVSENLYEENEKTQYKDEGNEPITIDQLREKFSYDSEEVKEENKLEEKHSDLVMAIDEIIKEETKVEKIEEVVEERPKVKLDDFSFKKEEKEEFTTRFKSSPIISPVFGIEKEENVKKSTELELEQTADLEKLDAEIRKTNQFLQLLKELQKKLD